MGKIRALIADDSLTIRKYIVEVISSAPGFEVVGEASDGKTAIELCERLRPDVVTMDMMMPVMSGLSATEYIMAYCPVPILIVSASTNRGELFRTYDALAAGALDVLEKPSGQEIDESWNRQLISTLQIISRVQVITHPRAKLREMKSQQNHDNHAAVSNGSSFNASLIAIGASTGGPAAVLTVLDALPATFPLPILLAIHISEPMGSAFAEWLDANCKLPVRFARDGESLPETGKGCVLLAPPGVHLELSGRRLRLTNGQERNFCRPSIDILFESIAETMGGSTIACLLTGMGKDGAHGLHAIRASGGLTIAQNEETCVVFGMPAEAIKLGGAMHVLPLGEIGPMLLKSLSKKE